MTYQKSPKISFKFHCEKCDYYSNKLSEYNKHLQTKKHNTYLNTDNFVTSRYICECGKKYKHSQSLYNHKKSCKILKNTDDENVLAKNGKKWQKMAKNGKVQEMSFFCGCGKEYQHQCSLSKHKKKCIIAHNQKTQDVDNTTTDIIPYNKDDLKEILKQVLLKHSEVLEKNDILMEKNEELLEKVTEIASQPKKVVNNNNTQFNVLNYLNTECKDAMDFNEFIDTFEFTLEDIDTLSKKGYQESMEKTFLKQLREMDKTKRPIHCSDQKRKSFYVKENGIWVRDTDGKIMSRGVKRVSSRHFMSLNQWRLRNPDYHDVDSKFKYHYHAMHQACRCNDTSHVKKVINKMTGLSVKG